MNILVIPLSLSFVVFVLLKTNAIYDFCGWFLKKISWTKAKQYSELSPLIISSVNYPLWLYNSAKDKTLSKFFLKLVNCPLCLSFWTNLIICFCLLDITLWIFNSFITLIGYCYLDKVYKHER